MYVLAIIELLLTSYMPNGLSLRWCLPLAVLGPGASSRVAQTHWSGPWGILQCVILLLFIREISASLRGWTHHLFLLPLRYVRSLICPTLIRKGYHGAAPVKLEPNLPSSSSARLRWHCLPYRALLALQTKLVLGVCSSDRKNLIIIL